MHASPVPLYEVEGLGVVRLLTPVPLYEAEGLGEVGSKVLVGKEVFIAVDKRHLATH